MNVDQETGEIVGAEFVINSPETFEWVMKKIHDAEIEILRCKSLADNIEAMKTRAVAEKNQLLYRFENELVHYAKSVANGKKSLLCQFGSVRWRTKPSKWSVVHEESAIEWAKKNCPAAVQVKEKLLLSEVVVPAGTMPYGLEFIPEGESVKIEATN